VSPATVSLVLRGVAGPSVTTRERVLEAAAQLGYRPDRAASLLASRRSRLIGVVMDIANPFHAQLVEDVQEAAEHQGYDVVLSAVTRGRDERRAIETLLDSRCEALVLLGPQAPAEQLAALDRQLPVVAVGRPVPSAQVDVVRAADDEGVALAVGPPGRARSPAHHLRRRRARRDTVTAPPRIPAGHARARPGRPHPGDQGRQHRGVRRHGRRTPCSASDPRPTAVLTFNDRAAMGLLDALVRAGVDVPGAVSVVGYDDSPFSRLAHIELTTVSQNIPELTEHAVAAVIERLDGGRTEHREVVVRPRLVVRGTTGPRPAGRPDPRRPSTTGCSNLHMLVQFPSIKQDALP
jgi:DNA-binding LacI/PurR family transcriptional regulator